MLEKEIEKKLVREVRKMGGRAYKWVSPGNGGVPDRIVVMPGGEITFVELKTDTGRLSKLQEKQIRTLTELGCCPTVVKGEEGLNEFLEALRLRLVWNLHQCDLREVNTDDEIQT